MGPSVKKINKRFAHSFILLISIEANTAPCLRLQVKPEDLTTKSVRDVEGSSLLKEMKAFDGWEVVGGRCDDVSRGSVPHVDGFLFPEKVPLLRVQNHCAERDTEMDEQQEQQQEEPAAGAASGITADATVTNAVIADQAAGGKADGVAADGASGGTTGPAPAPQNQKCRENSNVPLNKKS